MSFYLVLCHVMSHYTMSCQGILACEMLCYVMVWHVWHVWHVCMFVRMYACPVCMYLCMSVWLSGWLAACLAGCLSVCNSLMYDAGMYGNVM